MSRDGVQSSGSTVDFAMCDEDEEAASPLVASSSEGTGSTSEGAAAVVAAFVSAAMGAKTKLELETNCDRI